MKFFYYLALLLFFSSSFQWLIYAQWVVEMLEQQKIDQLENKIDTILDQAEQKNTDIDMKAQINEKQSEIEEFVKQQKETLATEKSPQIIKDILEETTKTVVLKAISGLTPQDDLTDWLTKNLEIKGNTQLTDAKEALVESLSQGDFTTLMISTSKSKEEIISLFTPFDPAIALDFLYDDSNEHVYELSVNQSSLLAKELLGDIDEAELPKHLLGIRIIKPELLQIGQTDLSLQGEAQDKLWGIQSFGLQSYLPLIQTKSLSKKIRIGIIDTGIDDLHPDLKWVVRKDLWYNFINDTSNAFDDQGHGTHIAGTIAGQINGAGVYGINPFVELVPLKICDAKGFCPSYAVLKSLSYAADQHLDILNMSLGAKGNPITSPVCDAIRDVTSKGTIVVSAAGNSNIDTIQFVPGWCREAITVGAVDSNKQRATFSNYGLKVDVSAPGVNIYSSYPGNSYKNLNGTSMATPHIVGVISLMKAFDPSLGTSEIKQIFKQQSNPVNTEPEKTMAWFLKISPWFAAFSGWVTTGTLLWNTGTTVQKVLTTGSIVQPSIPAQTGALPNNLQDGQIPLIIDTTIGVVVPTTGDEITKISSVEEELSSADQEETQINSDPGEEIGILDPNIVFDEEVAEINSVEEYPVFFGTDDVIQEEMKINGEEIYEVVSEETVYWSSWFVTWERKMVTLLADDEGEDTGDNTFIQSISDRTIKCTMTVGNYCEYYLYRPTDYLFYGGNANVWVTQYEAENMIRINGYKAWTATITSKKNGKLEDTFDITITNPIKDLKINYNKSSMNIWENGSVWVVEGNGGYKILSSNDSALTIEWWDGRWTMTAKKAGTSWVTISDSKNKQAQFPVTITNPIKNLRATITPSSLIMKDGIVSLSVLEWNGWYTVRSSDNSVFSVAGWGTQRTLQGKNIGTAMVYVKDAKERQISVWVTVYPKPLVLDTTALTIEQGKYGYVNITQGNGGYVASINNTNIKVYRNGVNGFTIYWNTIWKTTVNIRDSAGKNTSMGVEVQAVLRNLIISHSSISLSNATTTNFSVVDGNGGYTVSSSNTAIATVAWSNTNWSITAKAIGSTTMLIKDARGKQLSLPVTVNPRYLQLSTSKITLEEGSYSMPWSINDGNDGYTFAANNGIMTIHDNGTIKNSYKFYGTKVGTSYFQVRDSAGKVANMEVEVKSRFIHPTLYLSSWTVNLGQIFPVYIIWWNTETDLIYDNRYVACSKVDFTKGINNNTYKWSNELLKDLWLQYTTSINWTISYYECLAHKVWNLSFSTQQSSIWIANLGDSLELRVIDKEFYYDENTFIEWKLPSYINTYLMESNKPECLVASVSNFTLLWKAKKICPWVVITWAWMYKDIVFQVNIKMSSVPDITDTYVSELYNSAIAMNLYKQNEDVIYLKWNNVVYLSALAQKYQYFYNQVKTFWPRDYKNSSWYKWFKFIIFYKKKYPIDVTGNFWFWYSAMAGWIPFVIQSLWSTSAQITLDVWSAFNNLEWYNPLQTFVNEKSDIDLIYRWAMLYKKYGTNITKQLVDEYLNNDLWTLKINSDDWLNQTSTDFYFVD